MKTTVKDINQNSYDRRHKQSTIPPALAKDKEMKQEPIQKIQTRQHREQGKTPERSNCEFCGQQNRTPKHNCPAKTVKCNNCQKLGHFARVCRGKSQSNTRKIFNLEGLISEEDEE